MSSALTKRSTNASLPTSTAARSDFDYPEDYERSRVRNSGHLAWNDRGVMRAALTSAPAPRALAAVPELVPARALGAYWSVQFRPWASPLATQTGTWGSGVRQGQAHDLAAVQHLGEAVGQCGERRALEGGCVERGFARQPGRGRVAVLSAATST